ncbi:MAG: DUF1156 domain-containing protein [Chloroflexaceae bacterium]|nr:DUF1156 domain-containing protein [Chloroflexaceae bacterium]
MATPRRKLIEVALPLDAINAASAREKSIRHGHPSTLHLWWARRPLAACRAVLFATLIDDPSSHPQQFPTEEAQQAERQRLFALIEQLVLWESSNNSALLDQVRAEIARATGGTLPMLVDPFAGGGSIPLEAQRLGLPTYAGDLNPVAVVINKALIELPPRFAGCPSVHPKARMNYTGTVPTHPASGLAADVQAYGQWMANQAWLRIGHLYPAVAAGPAGLDPEATVIAWLWTRTTVCPNPACRATMPLARSLWLNSKRSRTRFWLEPVVQAERRGVTFAIRSGAGEPPEPPKIGRGAHFRCPVCQQVTGEHAVRRAFQDGQHGVQLMAIIAQETGTHQRLYLPADAGHVAVAAQALPPWQPDLPMNQENSNLVSGRGYGFHQWDQMFTLRQLTALATFSDLVGEAHKQIEQDALATGWVADEQPFVAGGQGARAYADAVVTYLALVVDRCANYWSSFAPWGGEFIMQTFSRQALPMVWDFAEANPFSPMTGGWSGAIDWVVGCLQRATPAAGVATVQQINAATFTYPAGPLLICTDPPYYNNIDYADLADFFYVWLRRSLKSTYPNLFATMLTPKAEELVATPSRFAGSRQRARDFFEVGMGAVFRQMRQGYHADYPLTLFYAFKQQELAADPLALSGDEQQRTRASTGWETMLNGLIQAGWMITATWPLRTERDQGLKTGSNVLASSIVLVCRPRPADAPQGTRRAFRDALHEALGPALQALQQSRIAPLDLIQAVIGVGMRIFSSWSVVLEADGQPMRVRAALQMLNQALDDALVAQEQQYDALTRWALAWFEQYGFQEVPSAVAERMYRGDDLTFPRLVEAGLLLTLPDGQVCLRPYEQYGLAEEHSAMLCASAWGVAHQALALWWRRGEKVAAGEWLAQANTGVTMVSQLLYRLVLICEQRGWKEHARAYQTLVGAL